MSLFCNHEGRQINHNTELNVMEMYVMLNITRAKLSANERRENIAECELPVYLGPWSRMDPSP